MNRVTDDQIFYEARGLEKKEHKDYFLRISLIAEWIAERLDSEGSKGKDCPVFVMSHKEKLGTVRIYCSFSKSGYIDAVKKYRKVYLEAKVLWPQYWYAISSYADWQEYLFETEEEFLKSYAHVHAYRSGELRNIYQVCGW